MAEKRQAIYILILALGATIAAVFGYGEAVVFSFQYAFGGWLLYCIYSGVQDKEYKRYRAVNGMLGIYVYVPYTKPKNNNDIAQKIAGALLALGIGLCSWHGYAIYMEHQKAIEAAAAIKAEANQSKPIITHPTPKRQESAAELEVMRRLGLGSSL
jgi:hypothetical protein